MEKIFFDNWESLFRTLVITVLAYISLIVMLRTSGKRTLSKMNAFDFIITIALGSAFATVMLNKDIVLADGLLAFGLLIGLQYGITWLSVRVKGFKSIITGKPALLLYKGEIYHNVLKKERITVEELLAAVRSNGFQDINTVDAVILETEGELTVLSQFDRDKQNVMDVLK